ncbi:MAG TPA: ATP-binding protein [Longimicrobiales bacterium]
MNDAEAVFAGPGEMRRRCRELDWSATPLGPVEEWPRALRLVVRTILDSPFPINLWCGEDRVLIYNDAYRHVLGAKHPGALGRSGWEVWAEIWPQIGPLFEQIAAGGPAAYAEDAPFIIERDADETPAPVTSAPNAWFTFSLSAVREEDGTIVAFLNIVSETTARTLAERARAAALAAAERAESRLRDVFAQAPAFMAVLRGPELTFEYANDAYYQLVGHRDLIGRAVFDALPEVRGQGFEQLLHSVMKEGAPYVGREVPLLVSRTRGTPPEQRYVDFVYYPLREPDGSSSGVVAHGHDVTDHVQAREEAQRARAEAEQANRAKSQFLANMSHEIRTPINAVVGYTDLLDAKVVGPLTEGQQEYVERIRASSRHLLALVNDVLDLSKIEAGEMLVRAAPASARDVLSSAVQMVLPEAEARGLTLREDWMCDEATRFVGDEDRVRQIVLNLLSNALKFTNPGGAVVARCRMVQLPAPAAALPDTGPWVVLEVEDTGVGIEAEEQKHIFQAFVQAESGHTRRAGGTGLGLTISRRLARLMSGDITVRSERGRGSCFSLWLPALVQDAVVARGTPHAEEPEPPMRMAHPFAAVAQVLLESAETIEQELVWRLRAVRGAEPGRAQADEEESALRARYADHTAALIASIGRAVAALEDPEANRDLLEDGAALRAELAGRHGAQRRRLGWTRRDVQREYSILRETIESLVQHEVRSRTAGDIRAALAAAHRLLDEAEARSLAAHDGN